MMKNNIEDTPPKKIQIIKIRFLRKKNKYHSNIYN